MEETDRMRLPALALTAAAACAGVALLALPGLGAAKTPETILPGHWEYSYRVLGIPAGTESKCLKPRDIEQFANGICTRRYTCVYETKLVENGKISLKGVWTDKKGRPAPVDAKGSYTPESFTMDVKLKTIHGMPLAGVMDAKRLGDTCPPDAK
jgi:hypothetical protein